MQLTKTPDTFVAVHDHVRRAADHDDDWHLLPGVGERGEQTALPRRLARAEPFVTEIQLLKFQLHRPTSVAPAVRDPSMCHVQLRTRPPTDDAVLR